MAQQQPKNRGLDAPVIYSFPPVADARAKTLILGSMPGAASLAAGEYYAHPRNLFWPIMGELVGAAPDLPYQKRTEKLKQARIALWDVLQSCTRQGSLDSNIKDAVPNDLQNFLFRHSQITRIFFNGGVAENAFQRVMPSIVADRSIELRRLPSTSPAHAALNFEQKREAWQTILA